MSNKFNAKKIVIDGIKFHSKKEGRYYLQLLQQKKATNPANKVIKIEFQPRYNISVNSKYIAFYKADFKVTYADEHVEIIDVKGLKKGSAYQLFRLKKKLVETIYNIEIIEK